jgi:hypothetical protein
MERRIHIPGRELGKAFAEMGQPKTDIGIARAVANDEYPARRDPRGKALEEAGLFVRPKIMEQIEENNVAALLDRFANVLLDKFQVAITSSADRFGASYFAPVPIEANDRRLKISLAQIEGEQSDATTDIDERTVRFSHQVKRRPKDRIEPKLAPRIDAQPPFIEAPRHPSAGPFVFRARGVPIFHCVFFVEAWHAPNARGHYSEMVALRNVT